MTSAGARAAEVADVLREAFASHLAGYQRLTSRARAHFDRADWAAARRDSAVRLDLYADSLAEVLTRLRVRLGDDFHDRALWRGVSRAYGSALAGRRSLELAETWFNSVTRRVFATTGVDPTIEFVHPITDEVEVGASSDIVRSCPRRDHTAGLVARLFDHHRLAGGYEDLARDATRVAAELDAAYTAKVECLETARSPFFRNKGAYLVGRALRAGGVSHPIVIAIVNHQGRARVDAVLLSEDEASIVFSFTRSYFFVETDEPRQLVGFLHSLLPKKPVSDLYDALGHVRHGKTELYRALLRQLAHSDDRFEFAPGQRGMVMLVFTLPSYDLVFKVIRDAFPPAKATSRRQVMRKYDLVFRHDRAGRLVDAREFEHLALDRKRFPEPLLSELARNAAKSVSVGDERVLLHHVYTERRVRPLDLYVAEAGAGEALAAVLDYGEAIRDLARSNIFPGDMLLKNFGVTRNGRVVFYDYDELAVLTDCRFREAPRERYELHELAGEPLFFVGENDVFPHEFVRSLELGGELREAFLARHAELLSTEFWTRMQQEHHAGRVPDVFPYPQSKRLSASSASGPTASRRAGP